MKAKIIFQRKYKNGPHYLRFYFDMQDEAGTCYWVFTQDKLITSASMRIGEGKVTKVSAGHLPTSIKLHLTNQGIKGCSPYFGYRPVIPDNPP